tara:strand:+ start:397 stop:1020 length:624 start_codon:yes stop_codon:yes gene_type:complete
MNFVNKIYAWILNNYIKVIVFIFIFGFSYAIYLYFYITSQNKDKEAGDIYLNFYSSYASSSFNEQDYKIALEKISQIDDSSIYLVMLKSINAADLAKKNNLQKALTELSNAKEIIENKSDDYKFLTEIINLRMVKLFIELEELETAKSILKQKFTTYQTNKLILEGDIFAKEQKFSEAKQKYNEALVRSENETQNNLIRLKISTLTE